MKKKLSGARGAIFSLVGLLFGATAMADTLVLKNGDRITGDIKRIWDAEVSIEPEYADEFNVDLEAIAHIESTKTFEIELADGTKLDATLAGADESGAQIIDSQDEVLAVPLERLFELNEPKATLEWDNKIEASFNINAGNTDSAAGQVRAESTVTMTDHRHFAALAFFREELAGVETRENDLFNYSYNYLYSDTWFVTADMSFERDPIMQLDNRTIISVGVGRDIWDTPRRTLRVQLGAGYQTEEVGFEQTDSAVAAWALRYRQDFFGDDFEIFHNHSITANVSGRTNTSYKTSTGLSYELNDLLSARLSLDIDYETRPVDVASNEDIALLFGLLAEF